MYWCLCVAVWVSNKFHLSDMCVVYVVCGCVARCGGGR